MGGPLIEIDDGYVELGIMRTAGQRGGGGGWYGITPGSPDI